MNYLKEFRAEASKRLDMVLEAPDNLARRREFLEWVVEKVLESYRNCQQKNQTTASPRTQTNRYRK